MLKKILLGILCVFLGFLVTVTAITMITSRINLKKARSFPAAPEISDPVEFENLSDGVWNVHTDRDIKVLQITDIHLGGGWMSFGRDAKTLNCVAAMVTAENPDLVVVTGDVAYPVFFQAGTPNNKTGAKLFANLMETLGVYWTVTFGNHDTELYAYFSREDIAEFYKGFPHCLLQSGPEEVDGVGNQEFRIMNSDGIITRDLILMDSHTYVDGDIFGIFWKYDNIHQNQVDWYKNIVKTLPVMNRDKVLSGDENADKYASLTENVPTTLFFHIPLTEYRDAWDEYKNNGYKDTDDVKFNYGAEGEDVCCGIHSDELFETALELGSTDAFFCGHDHINTFSLKYKGIYLNYSNSVDYLAYIGISKLGTQRGCTVIDIAEDGKMEFHPESYYSDKYPSFYEKEPVTMQEIINEG